MKVLAAVSSPRPWWERCGDRMPSRAMDDPLVDAALEEWARIVGDSARLERRLGWSGLSIGQVAAELSVPRRPPDTPDLKRWLRALEGAGSRSIRSTVRDASHEVILEALDETPSPIEVQAGAASDLGDYLARRLINILQRPLVDDFHAFRLGRNSLARGRAEPHDAGAFEAWWSRPATRVDALIEVLPGLAYLLDRVIQHCKAAISTLLHRLGRDLDRLRSRLGVESVSVARCVAGAGDPHCGGQTTTLISDASDRWFVYKPRDMSGAKAWNQLISLLREDHPELAPLAPEVVVSDGWGWMGHVRATRDAEPPAWEQFGAVLALAHVVDLHRGNLVQSGGRFAVVDLEGMWSPTLNPVDPQLPWATTLRWLGHDSVQATGVLPSPQVGPDEAVYDLSAIGGQAPQATGIHVPRMVGDGTGALRIEWQSIRHGGSPGARSNPPDSQALLSGFETCYRWAASRKEDLLQFAEIWSTQGSSRVVLRHTAEYSSAIRASLATDQLVDGTTRSIGFEHLVRPLLDSEEPPRWWPAIASELASCFDADIPYFSIDRATGVVSAHSPTGLVTVTQLETPAHEARARILALGPEDLHAQRSVIRASMAAHRARTAPKDDPLWPLEPFEFDVPDDWLFRTRALLSRILRARVGMGPRRSWLQVAHISGTYQVRPVGQDYYGGLAGLLTAMVHLARAHPSDALSDAISQTGDLLSDAILEHPPGPGAIHALAVGGRPEAAAAALPMVVVDGLDFLSGAAGAILSAASVFRATGDPRAAELARPWVDQLLAEARMDEGGCWWGTGLEGQGLASMAHGSAGIVLALASADAILGIRPLDEWIRGALRWEDDQYDPDRSEFQDRRQCDSVTFTTAWCNGSPGVILARLRLVELGYVDAAPIESLVRAALLPRAAVQLQELDHLCCGNGAIVATLLEAGRVLHVPSFAQAGTALADAMWRRGANHHLRLFPRVPDPIHTPGLIHGLAGLALLSAECHQPRGALAASLTMAP